MFGTNNEEIQGPIAYYKLTDWWLATFDEDKRNYIIEKYQPMGAEPSSLVKGKIEYSSGSISSFLSGLGSWFIGPNDREIGRTILEKAREEAATSDNPLDMHFVLSELVTVYYRDREKYKGFYEKAIQCCKDQIKLQAAAAKAFKAEYPGQPLPTHTGYEQLAIILEKEKKYQEAISLCLEAKSNGWNGDWDKRITRCKKRLDAK